MLFQSFVKQMMILSKEHSKINKKLHADDDVDKAIGVLISIKNYYNFLLPYYFHYKSMQMLFEGCTISPHFYSNCIVPSIKQLKQNNIYHKAQKLNAKSVTQKMKGILTIVQ